MENSKELLQEVFDKVVKHLKTQKVKSMKDGICVYRTKKNCQILKCAVGCLIPKKDYSEKFEENPANDLIMVFNYKNKYINDETIDLLIDLQDFHDNEPWTWNGELNKEIFNIFLKGIAQHYGLKYTNV